jgi:hypothetical protein
MVGTVVPYVAPAAATPPAERRAALATFLRSIDMLWADFYPGTAPALHLRHELNIPCRAVLFGGGTLPSSTHALPGESERGTSAYQELPGCTI